jgi:hypothetical protein
MHANSTNDHSNNVKRELKDKARDVANQAQAAAEGGKGRVVEAATGVARTLNRVSDELRSDDHAEVARYTGAVATKIEQLAEALKSRDLPAIAQDVRRLAQRQPALFLGGAFTLGLLGARFLKSSTPADGDSSRRRDRSDDSERRAQAESSREATPPAADDYGPAPGGYGPASAPAAAMGGNGNFGSEGTGGSAAGDPNSADQPPFERDT